MEELNQMSLSDLKNLAKEKGLKITGKNKKEIIIQKLNDIFKEGEKIVSYLKSKNFLEILTKI
mgnify:CR=1 FL=1